MIAATESARWNGRSLSGLASFLRRAQSAMGLKGEVEVRLTGGAELRALNQRFRGKDQTTDVLSFPAAAKGCAGDIVISAARARAQARAYGHSSVEEVKILLLHGLLHLAGMDHERDGGAMRRKEERMRRELGLPNGLIARAERPHHGAAAARKRAR